MQIPEQLSDVLDRLAARSTRNIETGCVTWDGARLKGYGVITVAGSARRVHNVAWRAWNGDIPAGTELDLFDLVLSSTEKYGSGGEA